MKIVLDSNVIIAANAGRGLCTEVFELCVSDHVIVLCKALLKEVENGLIKKIKVPSLIVKGIIEMLESRAMIVEPALLDIESCRDHKDVMVLGTAVSGESNLVITGDKDLLILKRYKHIKILTPREFWVFLSSQS